LECGKAAFSHDVLREGNACRIDAMSKSAPAAPLFKGEDFSRTNTESAT
jgi:hypothetical protein